MPATIYWSTGCFYDPTVYYSTMNSSAPFCTTCCLDCHKNGLPIVSYPHNTKLNKSNSFDNTQRSTVDNKYKKHCIDFPSNALNEPLSDKEEDEDTDSDQDSTEGDW